MESCNVDVLSGEALTDRVNIEFRKVVYYFRAHKLSLHPDKTKFIVFSF
jgi:hypothetical protein